MRSPVPAQQPRPPVLLARAAPLANYVQSLDASQLRATMHISPSLATQVQQTYAAWGMDIGAQAYAIDSFIGDIYSGLRASTLSNIDRDYADEHLRILSGLYGILRPYDGIMPYRLEMGYRLPDEPYRNLYHYWGDAIAKTIPTEGPIINVAAAEYTRAILPFIGTREVVSPQFLTVDAATGKPVFVVVHAKIARGAFARWLITSRTADVSALKNFNDIGYRYDASLSTPGEPAFVCQEFKGKGLSMRLEREPHTP